MTESPRKVLAEGAILGNELRINLGCWIHERCARDLQRKEWLKYEGCQEEQEREERWLKDKKEGLDGCDDDR